MSYTKLSLDKATLHIYKTTKFKKISIDVIISDYVNETNLSYRSLLARCMESKSKMYDSKKKISRKLDMLYGANFGIASLKIGKVCYLDASIDGVNPKYVGDSNLFNDFFAFLNEMLFNPMLDKENLTEEKRLLFDDYKAEYENKTILSVIRSNEIAFKNELARFKTNGEEEIVKTITVKALNEYYNYMINNNKVDIVIVGDVDDDVIDIVKKYLDFGVKMDLNPIDYEEKDLVKEEIVKEKAKSRQSQLVIKYRNYTRKNDKDFYALVLGNTIFGGFSSSLLFMNVREKNSLSYSISSTNALYKGCTTVTAGINAINYDNAVSLINEQLNDMKTGNFSDELLEMARLSLISSIKKGSDSLGSIVRCIYVSELLKTKFNIYEGIEELKNLTKDDVVKVFNKFKTDVIYFLEGCDSVE